MSPGHNSNQVVACAAYAEGRRVADVALEDISEVLKQRGPLRLDRPARARRGAAAGGAGTSSGCTTWRSRTPTAPTSGPSSSVRRLALHRRSAPRSWTGSSGNRIRRDAPLRRRPLRGLGAPRRLLSYADVRARCEGQPHLLAKGPGFVLYAHHGLRRRPVLPDRRRARGGASRRSRSEIFDERISRETTERIYTLSAICSSIKRAVSPLDRHLQPPDALRLDLIPDDTRPYFRDVYDHVIRINETVDTLRELLGPRSRPICR